MGNLVNAMNKAMLNEASMSEEKWESWAKKRAANLTKMLDAHYKKWGEDIEIKVKRDEYGYILQTKNRNGGKLVKYFMFSPKYPNVRDHIKVGRNPELRYIPREWSDETVFLWLK